MTTPQYPTGSFVLPVCIQTAEDIKDLLGAIDLYRVMRKSGKSYPALDAVLNSLDYADNPQDSPCLDIPQSTGACWAVDTTSRAIRFYPNDPFDQIAENRPIIGQWERWQVALDRLPEWADSILDLAENQTAFNRNIGYFPNDCFVVPPDESGNDVMQFFNSLNAIRKAEFPYIEVELQGTGELELHLLQVPFGGSAIIVWDMEFDVYAYLWDLVNGGSLPSGNIIQTELEREIATFPPESNEENVIEIDFTEDTDHIVRVYFVPRIDYTALDFLGNGGGIREISACDGLALKTESGELITKTTHRLDEFTKGNFIMTTQEDLCQAIICASEKIAQRILLATESDNIRNGVEIDKDTGQTIVKNTGGLGVKDAIDGIASAEVRNGGIYAQAKGIARLFSEIGSLKSNSFDVSSVIAVTRLLINPQDLTGWSSLVTGYFNDTESVAINIPLLAEKMFCNEIGTAIVEYALEEGHTGAEIEYLSDFVSGIPASTLDDWYQQGIGNPRNDYQSYGCYTLPSETFVITPENYASTMDTIWSQTVVKPIGNRWLFQVSGALSRADGRTIDLLYNENASNVQVLNGTRVLKGASSSSFTVFDSEPPFNPEHSYSLYVTANNETLQYPGGFTSLPSVTDPANNLTGSITVEKFDLGVS